MAIQSAVGEQKRRGFPRVCTGDLLLLPNVDHSNLNHCASIARFRDFLLCHCDDVRRQAQLAFSTNATNGAKYCSEETHRQSAWYSITAFSHANIDTSVRGKKPPDDRINPFAVCGVLGTRLPDISWAAHVHIIHFVVGITGSQSHLWRQQRNRQGSVRLFKWRLRRNTLIIFVRCSTRANLIRVRRAGTNWIFLRETITLAKSASAPLLDYFVG